MPDSEVSTNSGHMAIISPEDDGKNPACDKWNSYQLCPRRTILCSKLLHHNCRNSLCSNTKYHHLNYWLQRKVEPTSPTQWITLTWRRPPWWKRWARTGTTTWHGLKSFGNCLNHKMRTTMWLKYCSVSWREV